MIKKIKQLNRLVNNISSIRLAEDDYCLGLLGKLLDHGQYLAQTSMSLRPFALAFLVNEIAVNSRKNIIEFGSGISTILMARLLQVNGLPGKIISVDENVDWHRWLLQSLQSEKLADRVELIQAKLVNKKIGDQTGNHWYDQDHLQKKLAAYDDFDMVIIDGPTAYNKEIEMSRYFAIPFLRERLKDNCVFFIDDAARPGEQKVINKWKDEFQMDFSIYGETLGVCYKGEHFISNPLKFV